MINRSIGVAAPPGHDGGTVDDEVMGTDEAAVPCQANDDDEQRLGHRSTRPCGPLPLLRRTGHARPSVAPLTTTVMGAVSQQHAGIASGINNAVARTAGLLSIAVLGIVILAAFSIALDNQLAALHLAPAVRDALDAQRAQLAAAHVPASVTGPARASVQRALDEAYVAGFRAVMLVCVALAIASSAFAAALVEGAPHRSRKQALSKVA